MFLKSIVLFKAFTNYRHSIRCRDGGEKSTDIMGNNGLVFLNNSVFGLQNKVFSITHMMIRKTNQGAKNPSYKFSNIIRASVHTASNRSKGNRIWLVYLMKTIEGWDTRFCGLIEESFC